MTNQRVLLLDSDSNTRAAIYRLLDARSYHVITASSIQEMHNLGASLQNLDILIGKQRLHDGKIDQALGIMQKQNPQMSSFLLIEDADPLDLLKYKKMNVAECFSAPYDIPAIIEIILKNTESSSRTFTSAVEVGGMDIYQKFAFEDIIGRSPEMTKVLELVEKVADSDSTILIMGESGTGKELIAKALHYNSQRAESSLVPVNCGAIPSELLESELFGHVKGAFTGAIHNRIGRFKMADQGTLFLDEIGDMPLSLQVKLLRVLQDRFIEPVGSHKLERVNVRLIAATHVDLEEKVESGEFREDLFYRLNVIPIRIPSLRERPSDIPLLIQHFISKFNQERGRSIQGVSAEAMEQLMKYDWPGNIRELENLMERLSVIVGQGVVQLSDIPSRYLKASTKTLQREPSIIDDDGIDFNSVVDEFENRLILQALEKTDWNRNQAAKLLRLNRTTLVEKIKKKGLIAPEGIL